MTICRFNSFIQLAQRRFVVSTQCGGGESARLADPDAQTVQRVQRRPPGGGRRKLLILLMKYPVRPAVQW